MVTYYQMMAFLVSVSGPDVLRLACDLGIRWINIDLVPTKMITTIAKSLYAAHFSKKCFLNPECCESMVLQNYYFCHCNGKVPCA